VISIDRGRATALSLGEADILAVFDQKTGVKEQVLALPDGTYWVRGVIRDRGLGLAGARVEVTAGSATGLAVTTDGTCLDCGGYALYGVFGPTTIRVSKDGYDTRTIQLTVTAHQLLPVDLVPTVSPPDPSGLYRLTITAADECRAALPHEAQERSYLATVTRDGARQLKVKLEAGAFDVDSLGNGSGFAGAVEATRALFVLSAPNYSPWDYPAFSHASIMERLSSTGRLAISGAAGVSTTAAGMAGTLDGAMEIVTFVGDEIVTLSSCRSPSHRIAFQR
jgi:hypothetical protein